MHSRAGSTRSPRDADQNRFVGRAAVLGEIAGALTTDRLVEIVGPPGVGKTRLALELGAQAAGVTRFCDLIDATSLEAFLLRVARAVALRLPLDASTDDLAARVRDRLAASEPALLVLDNFEQLPPPADAALASWFETAEVGRPGVRVVVTSRRRLVGASARTVVLSPLAIAPAPGARWSEAAELLVARAELVAGAGFDAREDRATIEELARELDGLPLAIELAAARFRVLAPRQVLARLSERFRMLRRADGEPRADLRATIETSFAMLAPAAQRAFLASAVFRGGFNLDAAEAVLAEESGAWPLDLLEALLHQSMLTVDLDPRERRYDLLICIREFAEAEAAKDGSLLERAMTRHADHYVELGERLIADAGASSVLERERDNLAAIVRRRDRLGSELALRAALVLAAPAAGLPYIAVEEVLATALVDVEATSVLVGRAFLARGTVLRFLGRVADSSADLERARAIAETAGDRTLLAEALAGLGNTTSGSGDWARARAFFERGLDACTDPRFRARLLMMYANSFGGTDDYDRSVELFQEAIAAADAVAESTTAAMGRLALGVILVARGDIAEAEDVLGVALEAHARAGSLHWEGIALSYLARCKQEKGDLAGALILYPEALNRLEAAGVRRGEAVALYQFGTALVEAGELDAAAKNLRAALPLIRENCAEYEGVVLAAQGVVAARRGAKADAQTLYRRAEAALRGHHKPTFLAAVRVFLDEEPPPALANCSEVRLARRLRVPSPAPEASPPLLVARDGSWFRAPGTDASVALGRRKTLRGVLAALAQHRRERPGEAASLVALVEAGWPGERILANAGAERVYAAVATLRRLGLRGVIQQKADGYLLSPEVPLVFD